MIYQGRFLSNAQRCVPTQSFPPACSGGTPSALFRNEARFGRRSRVGRRGERLVPQTGRLNPPHLSFSGFRTRSVEGCYKSLTLSRHRPYTTLPSHRCFPSEGGATWTSFARA